MKAAFRCIPTSFLFSARIDTINGWKIWLVGCVCKSMENQALLCINFIWFSSKSEWCTQTGMVAYLLKNHNSSKKIRRLMMHSFISIIPWWHFLKQKYQNIIQQSNSVVLASYSIATWSCILVWCNGAMSDIANIHLSRRYRNKQKGKYKMSVKWG